MIEIKSVREPEGNEPEAILNGHAFRVPEVEADSVSDRMPDEYREHIRNRFQAVD